MNPHPLGVAEDRTTPERAAPAIRLEGATGGYGDGPHILTGVTLELAAGATAVIQGGAGSGKSTLIHMLRGALVPREGRVLLLGSDVAALPSRTRAALKRRIGYIAQTPLLRDDLGAGDNIMAPLLLTPAAAAASYADVTDMLAYLGLTPVAHQPAGELSHVQRRLTAIARAFVARPDIVLADEPLAGLGADAGGRVLRLLSEMARQRATVVIATHAPEMFAALPAARWRLDGGALSAAPA